MDTPLTLEQVAEKFKNWRATRTQREKIPDNLLAEVAELKKHHKNSHIARALQMNGGQVKALSPKNLRNFEFAELPPIFQKLSAISCDFSKADGTHLKVDLRPSQLPEVLKAFLCYK